MNDAWTHKLGITCAYGGLFTVSEEGGGPGPRSGGHGSLRSLKTPSLFNLSVAMKVCMTRWKDGADFI
jgi:hypothetical protein